MVACVGAGVINDRQRMDRKKDRAGLVDNQLKDKSLEDIAITRSK